MSSDEGMSEDHVAQQVFTETSPALTLPSDGQQPSKTRTDLPSQITDDSISAAALPSRGSCSSISSEDLESRTSVSSNPATILPSSAVPGIVCMSKADPSTPTTNLESQEIAPRNETTTTQPEACSWSWQSWPSAVSQDLQQRGTSRNQPGHGISFTENLSPSKILADKSYRVPPPESPWYPPPACIPYDVNMSGELFATEDIARKVFLDYAKRKLCYSTAPAQKMTLLNLSPVNTFKYYLETFAESRFCTWKKRPYHDDEVDGPENGRPPYPWDVAVEAPELFTRGTYKTALPHTSSVETCWNCSGNGKTSCTYCCGVGRKVCLACGGLGWTQGRMCFSCSGSGRSLCFACSGQGHVTCDECCGRKKLVMYIELTVSWEVFTTAVVTDQETVIPVKKLMKVTGLPVFKEEQVVVPPIMDFSVASVNETSQKIMREHLSLVTSCRVLGQKQTLQLLPVTKVEFTWKENKSDFFIFGNEFKVYTKSYPQTCCCSIM